MYRIARYIKFVILLILAFITFESGAAVDLKNTLQSEIPYFETFRDGMPSKMCKILLEDQEGFIWIGTRNGIVRYDGITMVDVFSAYGKSKFDYEVWAMCEDTSRDCIWVSFGDVRKPLCCIDKKTFKRTELKTDFSYSKTNSPITTVMKSIASYNDTILIGCDWKNGIYLINKNTGSVSITSIDEDIHFTKIFKFGEQIYFILNQQLCHVVGRDPNEINYEQLCKGHIRFVDIVSDSTLAYMVPEYPIVDGQTIPYAAIYEINVRTKDTKLICRKICASQDALTHPFPSDFVVGDDGIWITNQYGISFFRHSDGKIIEYSSLNTQLRDNNVLTCIKSRNQPIYWFGTEDGLVKNDYYAAKFNLIDMTQSSESVRNKVYMLHNDYYGNCWVWCLDGLFFRGNGDVKFRAKSLDGHFERESILNTMEDTVNHCLYFQSTKHLLQYEQLTGKCTYIFEASAIKDSQRVKNVQKGGKIVNSNKNFNCATMREDGVIVLTAGDLICLYDIKTKQYDIRDISGLFGKYTIKTMAVDGDSVLWILNSKGQLYSYNFNKNVSTPQYIDSLRAEKIEVQWRGGERELWLATSSNGFYYFLPERHKLQKLTYSRFLLGEVPTFEIDKNKNVWVATNEGIVCINNTTGIITEFSREKYSICQEFNRRASTVSYNGDILMAGQKYIVEFNTKEVQPNDYFPAPRIVSYEFLNSTTFSFDSYTSNVYYNVTDTIVIPRGIRSIRLTARMLNYSSSARNNIQWRIPNLDQEWHTISTVSPLIFDFPMGMHCLEMRSCDNENNPTDNISRVWFDKQVYFYETPYFLVLMGILAIVIIVSIIRGRSRIARRRRIKLQAEVERQAGDIRRANERLQKTQHLIEIQNLQLQQSRDNLEIQVAERTAELEAAMKKAEENSKLKSAFLANLSHEVRTPMNCIVGFSKLLGDPSCSPHEKAEFIHLIQESSAGLLVLIGDLLDVSRIESGQLRVNRREFNIYNEINDVYGILAVEKKNPYVEFLLDIDNNLKNMSLYSDKDRVRQIIINITYNAFKFTENGHVKIDAKLVGAETILKSFYPFSFPNPPFNKQLLLVCIEDTGIGIPADKLDVIFEPFRKLNNNKTLYPGLGLGLNIVKNLVQLLDGQIWVRSEVGQGTKFYFYLPFSNPLEIQ